MFRTHSAEIALSEAQLSDARILGYAYPSSVSRTVDFQPGTAKQVFDQFGVEESRGFFLYDRPLAGETIEEIALYYATGAQVTIGETNYMIAHKKVWSGLGSADYVECLCMEAQ